MAINISTTVATLTTRGDAITARHMGMNLSQGYERFGTLPWEKFDEVQSQIGSKLIRFPGGTEAETLFDYANPQATSAISPTGQVMSLTTPAQFLAYCKATGSQATIVLNTVQLLSDGAYGTRDFDTGMTALVRNYVRYILETAGPGGIATFELGNEYAGYMNAVEYGKVSSALALIVDQEIDRYYDARPGLAAPRPDVAVQVWVVSAGESFSMADLAARNQNVMAQFNSTELAAITASTTHFYYTEGKFAGQANSHTYTTIAATLGYSMDLLNAWSIRTGRQLDTVISEWNVHFRDVQSFGLQQVPLLLQMFSAYVALGVDELDIWSTMYNASALADFRGQLQASGVVMQIMAREVVGMRVADVPVASAHYDIHGFSDGEKTYLFVSSLSEVAVNLNMNLANYLDRFDLTSVRRIGVDASGADGAYKGITGLAPWEEPDAPVRVTAQSLALSNGVYGAQLGAHETLVLQLTKAQIRMGSMAADTMTGLANANDRIDSMAANDKIYGLAGHDTLLGGVGHDAIWGGEGNDRLWGGPGSDTLYGGAGNDVLEGRINPDVLFAGLGNDYISGGEGSDTLWGAAGADAFVFRAGESGTDIIRDFNKAEFDYLIYEGHAAVTAANFTLERKVIAGVGGAGAELLVHWGGLNGPVLAILQDGAGINGLTLQDGTTGAMLTL